MSGAGKGRPQGELGQFLAAFDGISAQMEPLAGNRLQRLFRHLLVADLLLKEGWGGESQPEGGVVALWDQYRRHPEAVFRGFCADRLHPLFTRCGFSSLLVRAEGGHDGTLQQIGGVDGVVPGEDEAVEALVEGLFRRFPFTIPEGGPLDAGVQLGPQVMASLLERSIPGRHEKGSYYTPPEAVAFIARQALRCYLETRLPEESSEALARLVEGGDAIALRDPARVLAAVRRVKLCDPACGGGAFLVGAMEELLRLRLRLGEGAEGLSRLRAEILRDNLYGVDLAPEAVEVARLRLALATLSDRHGEDTAPVSVMAVRVGDSLLDFDWVRQFPETFAEGGFDIVLMNPPYLLSSRVPGHAREQFLSYSRGLRARFGFSGDLYVFFFFRALQILNPAGILGALTSASFLTNSTKEQLRQELLHHDLRLIAPLGPELFDAQVYPAITILRKGGATAGVSPAIGFLDLRGTSESILKPGLVDRQSQKIAPSEYRDAFQTVFFDPTPENRRIYRDLLTSRQVGERRFVTLGEVAPALDTGIHSGNVRERLFYREPVKGKTLHRLIQGTQVVRYGVWWENPEARYRYVDLDYRADPQRRGIGRGGRTSGRGEYWHFCGSMENHHVEERLLMRQTGDRPFVGYLYQGEERIYTDNTLHTLLLSQRGRDMGFSYPYLLALLNCEAVARVYHALAQEEGRILAQVKVSVANRLPLPLPEQGEAATLEALVSEIQGIYRSEGLPLPPAAAARLAGLQATIDRMSCRLYGLGDGSDA